MLKFIVLRGALLYVWHHPYLLTIPAPEIPSSQPGVIYFWHSVFIFIAFHSCAQQQQIICPFFLSLFLACSACVKIFSKLITRHRLPLWIFPWFISFVWCHSFASAAILTSASHEKACSNTVNFGLRLTAGLLPAALIIDPWAVSSVSSFLNGIF